MDEIHDIIPYETSAVTLTTADIMSQLATFLRLNVAQGDASEATIRMYMSHVKTFIGWCEENDVNPARATEHDLMLYRRWLSVPDGAGYARNTVSAKLSAIRRFYEAAIWRGLRNDNPAAGLRPPREHTSTHDRILKRYLDPNQVRELLAAPDTDTDAGKRDLAMIALMYYHGLRVSEVVSLTVDDVAIGRMTRLTIRQAKGKRDRTIFLVPTSEEILMDWLKVRYEHLTDETNGVVFVSFNVSSPGTPLSTDGVRWVVNGYLRELGFYRPGLSCHALRHAHASHVIAKGGNVMPLAKEMGHASPETTQVYVNIVDAVKQNPAALLAKRDSERAEEE